MTILINKQTWIEMTKRILYPIYDTILYRKQIRVHNVSNARERDNIFTILYILSQSLELKKKKKNDNQKWQ